MINLELRNVCSLFSLRLPWVVTLDPARSLEHLWKPTQICLSKQQNIQSAGPASSLFRKHPSFPPSEAKLHEQETSFRRHRLKQTGQAFPVGGTWEQRHSWARHLHFLSLLTTCWKTQCLDPFLFYTLLQALIQQQKGLKCRITTTARKQ